MQSPGGNGESGIQPWSVGLAVRRGWEQGPGGSGHCFCGKKSERLDGGEHAGRCWFLHPVAGQLATEHRPRASAAASRELGRKVPPATSAVAGGGVEGLPRVPAGASLVLEQDKDQELLTCRPIDNAPSKTGAPAPQGGQGDTRSGPGPAGVVCPRGEKQPPGASERPYVFPLNG